MMHVYELLAREDEAAANDHEKAAKVLRERARERRVIAEAWQARRKDRAESRILCEGE